MIFKYWHWHLHLLVFNLRLLFESNYKLIVIEGSTTRCGALLRVYGTANGRDITTCPIQTACGI